MYIEKQRQTALRNGAPQEKYIGGESRSELLSTSLGNSDCKGKKKILIIRIIYKAGRFAL